MSEEEKGTMTESQIEDEKRKKEIRESLDDGLAMIFYRRHAKNTDVDIDDKFDVEVPTSNKAILIGILVILVISQYLVQFLVWLQESETQAEAWSYVEWWPPLVFLACTIGPILLWGKLGPELAQKNILTWLKKTVDKKPPTIIEFIFGFPRSKDPYFIEANPMDFDISKTRMFLNRVKEAIFLSIGLSVIITKAMYSIPIVEEIQMEWGYSNVVQAEIFSTIYLGPLALIILFLVMPLIWISEDMQIYRIDDLQDPHRVGTYVRAGLLSKILGFFGIILAFDLSKEFAQNALVDGSSIEIYSLTAVYFIMIFFSLAAYPYLATLVYLMVFHQEWVNTTRIRASAFMPCASVQVNYVKDKELEYLTHQERIKEFDKPDIFDEQKGKIIILAITIVVSIIALYLAFFY